ncbi:MAG TPA: hypothetical protein VK721_11085 [Solirubrobacteraceae bacterium]|jgi:hypothetical protein|nr:hypothetical protein [Solirubrobacteraceae bacterium]
MTDRERQRLLTQYVRLRAALRAALRENKHLREANANLRVERDAADVLLGEAMDRLVREGGR